MGFVEPPLATTVAFMLIGLGVQGALLFAIGRTDPARAGRRVAVGAIAFALTMLGIVGLIRIDWLAPGGMPPPALVYALTVNLVALGLALGPPGAAMASAVAPVYWVWFQSFRLPLEIVLHLWHEAGTIPIQMTWSGQNLDVVTGLVSIGVGLAVTLAPRLRRLAWLAHGVGLVLLFNVGRIAILSVPSPLRAFEGAPLLLPFVAPYAFIVPFAVAAALFGHVVGIRALLRAKKAV